LAATYPQLACLGETIIRDITELMEEGSNVKGVDFSTTIAQLPDLLMKVM
jgi:hypothetical protein